MENKIIIYRTENGTAKIETRLENETVWLTQGQMSLLFERERSVITKHIRNIFVEGELRENVVRANFAHTADDGKTYQVEHYNLDVIISVGYRVNSKQGTQFRQWATQRLKDYLIKGYAINQKRLDELSQMVSIIEQSTQSNKQRLRNQQRH